MVRRLTRRQMLKLTGGTFVGAYAFALAGCGGQGDGGQLRVAWWGAQERHERTQRALELYQERNEEISIDAEFSDWDGYWDRIATQTGGGNAPDLLQTDYRYLSEYAGRGVLLDLDQFAGEIIDLSSFEVEVIEGGRIDGGLYAITLGNNSQVITYDVTAFEEVGMEMPDHTWVWEDLATLAAEISHALGEDTYGIVDAGAEEPALEVFVRQRGKELYTEDGQLGFDKEDLAEWWMFWDEMRASGAATPGEITSAIQDSVDDSPMIRGQAAMHYAVSNQFTALNALTDRQLDINMLPNGSEQSRPGQYLKPSQLISGYSDTQAPEEVARVIDFLLNDPEANEILGTERGISGSSEIRDLLEPQVPEEEQRVFDYLELVQENSSPLPPPPPQGAGEIDQLVERVNERIAFGELSVEEGVDRFFSEAERILS